MKWSVLSKISIGFVALITTVSITGTILIQIPLRQSVATRWVQHTHEVLLELETILSNITNAETGQRGYLLTGDERYLEPYHSAMTQIDTRLQRLRTLIADNSSQQSRRELLERQIDARLGLIEQTIELRRKKGFQPAVQVIFSGWGKQQMDAIRASISEMEQEENELLEHRIQTARAIAQLTTQVFLILMLLSLTLICVVYYLVNSDLTFRKQAEKELRRREAELRVLNAALPVGVFKLDPQGNCTYTNPRVQEICGFTFDEALATGWQQFIHPDDKQQLWVKWQAAAIAQQEFSGEVRYLHRDGTVRFGRVKVAPIFADRSDAIGYVGTIEDITEIRAVEKIKNEFISVVSHELRTPLASIRGAVGLLSAGLLLDEPETAQEMLEIASFDTERLVRLVNDILDLERLESHKLTLTKQWCDAAILMRRAVESLQPIAEENNITLSLTPRSVQIHVDPDRIIQTLVNLLSNAVKFSPPGATVWLSAQLGSGEWRVGSGEKRAEGATTNSQFTIHNSQLIHHILHPTPYTPSSRTTYHYQTPLPTPHSPLPTPYITFQVKDTGRGIPADKLGTIFERFQQVDASDSRQKGGTGLGLAICRTIAQLHGGQIWVESVLGQGSTFYFSIPISKE